MDHALKCDTHDCACSFCEEVVESSVYNSQAWRMVIDTTSIYTCVPSAWWIPRRSHKSIESVEGRAFFKSPLLTCTSMMTCLERVK